MGDPSFTICDTASKSLVSITGASCRKPYVIDPTKGWRNYSKTEAETLRRHFQDERLAWIQWLEKAHPEINHEFDPYEKIDEHVDEPTITMGLRFE